MTQEQINALVHIGIQLLQLINMRITAGTFDSVQTSMIVHTKYYKVVLEGMAVSSVSAWQHPMYVVTMSGWLS